jgi:uncharacterized protein with NRDE domain
MCTVSYIVQGRDKYFTSNRDENKQRPTATRPQTFAYKGMKLTYPKDPQAGGSWFVVAENGTIGILLNGAFEKHIPVYPYRKSRGLILLDIFAEAFVLEYFEKYNLIGIEPFTIILFYNNELFELRWDSSQKFIQQLDTTNNYIWSSATLYDAVAMKNRAELFQAFITTQTLLDASLIRQFHSNNYGDDQNGFIINRENGIQTQSITQAILQADELELIHQDLISQHQSAQKISLQKRTIKSV